MTTNVRHPNCIFLHFSTNYRFYFLVVKIISIIRTLNYVINSYFTNLIMFNNVDITKCKSYKRNADNFYQESINFDYLEKHQFFYFPKLFNELPNNIKCLGRVRRNLINKPRLG